MLLAAADNHDINLERSFVVGDKASDLRAGLEVGCQTVLVRTGYGREEELAWNQGRAHANPPADRVHVADDLSEAAAWILAQLTRPNSGRQG